MVFNALDASRGRGRLWLSLYLVQDRVFVAREQKDPTVKVRAETALIIFMAKQI